MVSILFERESSFFSFSFEMSKETVEWLFMFLIEDFRTLIPPRDFIPQALINTLFTYKQF